MQIVQRHNKYFLQFASGELELSEQQVQRRLERGDKVMNQLQALQDTLPEIDSNIKIEKTTKERSDFSFSPQSYSSAKYFDHILYEFEQIYRANIDDTDALEKLKKFCKNSIQKLEKDRKSPKTDHIVIDYYLLSWNRVCSFLDTLPEKVKRETNEQLVSKAAVASAQVQGELFSTETKLIEPTFRHYIKQLLIIQLMQADGIFPINNAIEGVTQNDIQKLITGVLGVREDLTHQALHAASSILLKRDISTDNVSERIQILEEVESFFEELPYPNIISRVKLLLKLYRDKTSAQ